jgi:hypothetical protein
MYGTKEMAEHEWTTTTSSLYLRSLNAVAEEQQEFSYDY